jgi:hypothetical protein
VSRIETSGLTILAVCLVFALCFRVGGALSGLNKIGQQGPPAQPAMPSELQAARGPQAPQKKYTRERRAKTDSTQVLSSNLLKKAEEIENLAHGTGKRSKG